MCRARATGFRFRTLPQHMFTSDLAVQAKAWRRNRVSPSLRRTCCWSSSWPGSSGGGGVRRRRRLPSCFETALCLFEESVSGTLAVGSVRLVVGETRQLLTHLRDPGHHSFCGVGLDDVRGFLMAVALKHLPGMRNTVWAVKRFFRCLNDFGLSGLRVDQLLSQVSARRVRVLPRFTQDEIGRLLAVIDTATAAMLRRHGRSMVRRHRARAARRPVR